MKTFIIGAGASGVVAGISLKQKYPDEDITIIDHLDKPLKKILATGNGKCNLGNSKLNLKNYANAGYIAPIMRRFGYVYQRNFFKEIGVETKLIDNLLYPVSESSITVREALLEELNKENIKLKLEEKLIDYKVNPSKITLITDKNKYFIDRLIIATGGASSPKLGSDGSIFNILDKHGYSLKPIAPGLVYIRTKENTKLLDGTRVKANVKLFKNHTLIHEEKGEVLFKSHGLSGIVIMNISNIIARNSKFNYSIELDLLEDYKKKDLENYISLKGEDAFLKAFLHPNMIKYFKENKINPIKVKNLLFKFDSLGDFANSQITIGGIDFIDIKDNLESKREKNVYFIGEVLDVDGPCGGYNLSWAFASALSLRFY